MLFSLESEQRFQFFPVPEDPAVKRKTGKSVYCMLGIWLSGVMLYSIVLIAGVSMYLTSTISPNWSCPLLPGACFLLSSAKHLPLLYTFFTSVELSLIRPLWCSVSDWHPDVILVFSNPYPHPAAQICRAGDFCIFISQTRFLGLFQILEHLWEKLAKS